MFSKCNTFMSCTIAITFLAGPSVLAEGYSVKAISRANNFPEVELVVNIRNEKTQKGLYGKEQSDFEIFEDGVIQPITAFSKKGEGKVDPIDIVFVFDETGSMQNEINAVRDNCLMFADYLSSSNMNYRLALVTFSDKIEKKYDFTTDIAVFKNNISNIIANGGGDEPENALDALASALELEFREKAKVVFILITDAPYHQGNTVTKRFMLPLAKKIKLEGISIYPITVKLEQYVWMARETDGTYFNILDDFNSIIEKLAVELTAQYRITYIPKRSSFDNTKRNVEIQVKNTGKIKTEYKSSANITVSSQLMESNRPADAYKPENMVDGKKETAWSEGDPGDGVGQWVKFGLDETRLLKAIKIIPGYAKTDKIFNSNNHVKKLKITFHDGKSQTAEIKDSQDFQRILIDRDTPTSFVKIEILEIYKGLKFNDACISEIEFEFKE